MTIEIDIKALVAVVSPIAVAVVTCFLNLWRDQAVMKRDISETKRDIDGIADHVGTVRAKARRPRTE